MSAFQCSAFQDNAFLTNCPRESTLPPIKRDLWDTDEWGRFVPGAGYHYLLFLAILLENSHG